MMVTDTTQPTPDAEQPAFGMRNFGNVIAVYVELTGITAHGLPYRATTYEQIVGAIAHLNEAAKYMEQQRHLEYYKSSGKADIAAERRESRKRGQR